MKFPEIKIFVFHYKHGSRKIGGSSYIQVIAGGNKPLFEEWLVGDNSGDNISDRNRYYSEMTGIYWAWKNHTADIWGFCHYRRFFTLSPEPLFSKINRVGYYLIGIGYKRHGLIYTSHYRYWEKRVISAEEINMLMLEFDVVLPVKRKLKYTVEEHYNRYHHAGDLKILRGVISDISPEYIASFDRMLCQKNLYANNMMIIGNTYFRIIMEWLFKILFEFEKRVNLDNYRDYQERIFGFLSERLLTCWFMHHNLKIKELNLIYFKKLKYAKALKQF